MTRWILLLVAVMFATAACRKGGEKPTEKQPTLEKPAPLQPSMEEPVQKQPSSEKPVQQHPSIEKPVQKQSPVEKTERYKEYTRLDAPDQGPPSPPVGQHESVKPGELGGEWTPVEVAVDRGGNPTGFTTQEEAALMPETLNNRGLTAFEVILSTEWTTFERKFVPERLAFLDFLQANGVAEPLGYHTRLLEDMRADFDAAQARYGEFVRPLKRQDRIGGVTRDGMARLSRWSFEYKDKGGETRQDCILFLLVNANWTILDIGCDREPWRPDAPPPAVESPRKPVETIELEQVL
jgi:hypothetical protein